MNEILLLRVAEMLQEFGANIDKVTTAQLSSLVRAVQEWGDEVIGLDMDLSGRESQDHMIISNEKFLARKLAVDVMEKGYVMVSRPKMELVRTDGPGSLFYTRLCISVPVRKA